MDPCSKFINNYRNFFIPSPPLWKNKKSRTYSTTEIYIYLNIKSRKAHLEDATSSVVKWLKVEGSANSIHIEKKLYYELVIRKRTFKIMMMNCIFLKKLFFWIFYLLVLTISFENVKLKYGDIQMYSLKPTVHILV